MKKILIGCGVAFVALCLLGGGAFYYFVYEPFVSDYVGGIAQLAEITQVNDQIRNQSSYEPPDGGRLTEAQVGRFMRVQQGVRKKMGRRFRQLQQHYEKLNRELNRQGRDASYREVLAAWSDFSDLILEAKRRQVEALNAQGFSLQEYRWVRAATYRAAGASVPQATFGEMLSASQSHGSSTTESRQGLAERTAPPDSAASRSVSRKNQQLVAPFAQALKENAGLAWFGL